MDRAYLSICSPKANWNPDWETGAIDMLSFYWWEVWSKKKKEIIYRAHLGARRIGHLHAGSEIN